MPKADTTEDTTQPAQPAEQKAQSATASVTSSKTIDFLGIGWSIEAGETKDLPADVDAQAVILANGYITKV